MFGNVRNMMDQVQMMQKLMKDENFKALIMNPKVREVFMDPEFQSIVKEQNFGKLATHPKFNSLMQDPEVRNLILKMNPASFKN